jgi:hypothetical protein
MATRAGFDGYTDRAKVRDEARALGISTGVKDRFKDRGHEATVMELRMSARKAELAAKRGDAKEANRQKRIRNRAYNDIAEDMPEIESEKDGIWADSPGW